MCTHVYILAHMKHIFLYAQKETYPGTSLKINSFNSVPGFYPKPLWDAFSEAVAAVCFFCTNVFLLYVQKKQAPPCYCI